MTRSSPWPSKRQTITWTSNVWLNSTGPQVHRSTAARSTPVARMAHTTLTDRRPCFNHHIAPAHTPDLSPLHPRYPILTSSYVQSSPRFRLGFEKRAQLVSVTESHTFPCMQAQERAPLIRAPPPRPLQTCLRGKDVSRVRHTLGASSSVQKRPRIL